MKRRFSVIPVISMMLIIAYPSGAKPRSGREAHGAMVSGQESKDAGITQTRVLGEVTEIDLAGKRLVIKTDAGNLVTVICGEGTDFLRVPPGETSLDKAVKVAISDFGVGDKVYVRGRVSEDRKSIPAQKLIVMVKADIERKRELERGEWRRRGISGIITALNSQAKEISLQARGRDGVRPVVITAPDSIQFRRYAPDSVKFSDARASSFTELQAGDQLRALGEKSGDGARFRAEQVVSGSFRTVGGTVTAVSPLRNEIRIEILGNRQPLTIVVNKDSLLRRIPPQMATFIAQRSEAGAAGGPGGQPVGRGSSGSSQPPSTGTGAPRVGPPGDLGGPGGVPGGGRARMEGGGDFQDMLERMPAISLEQIKPGDVVAVSSTVGADPSRLTAITLVAGVDAVLAALQSRGAPRRALNLSTGLPAGVLDFSIAQP